MTKVTGLVILTSTCGETLGCIIGTLLYDVGNMKIQCDIFCIVVILCTLAYFCLDQRVIPHSKITDEYVLLQDDTQPEKSRIVSILITEEKDIQTNTHTIIDEN